MPYTTTEIKRKISEEARRQGVDPFLALALVWAESDFSPNVKSGAGAIGLFQLLPTTAAGLKVNPNNVDDNIKGGVTYLKQQLKTYKGDVNLALAAYNAGPGAVKKYGNKIPPYKETRDYVNRINSYYKSLTSQLPNKTNPVEEIAQGLGQGLSGGLYKAPDRFQGKPLTSAASLGGQFATVAAANSLLPGVGVFAALGAQGATNEYARQAEEQRTGNREQFSPSRIATSAAANAALGFVPVSAPGNLIQRGISGAVLGGGANLASNAAGNIVDPNNQRNILEGVGEGAALGGAFGAALGARKPQSIPTPEPVRSFNPGSNYVEQGLLNLYSTLPKPNVDAMVQGTILPPVDNTQQGNLFANTYTPPPVPADFGVGGPRLLPEFSTAEAKPLPQGQVLVGGADGLQPRPAVGDLGVVQQTLQPEAPVTIGRPQVDARQLSLPNEDALRYAEIQNQIQQSLGLPENVAPIQEQQYTNAFVADNYYQAKERLGLKPNATAKDIFEAAKKQGYDGVIYQTKDRVVQKAFPENRVETTQQQVLPLDIQRPLQAPGSLVADSLGSQAAPRVNEGLSGAVQTPDLVADRLPGPGQQLLDLQNTPPQIQPISPYDANTYVKPPSLRQQFTNTENGSRVNINFNNPVEVAMSNLQKGKTPPKADLDYLKQAIPGATDEQLISVSKRYRKEIINKSIKTGEPIPEAALQDIVNQETLKVKTLQPEAPSVVRRDIESVVKADPEPVKLAEQPVNPIKVLENEVIGERPNENTLATKPKVKEVLPESAYIPRNTPLPEGAVRVASIENRLTPEDVVMRLANERNTYVSPSGREIQAMDVGEIARLADIAAADPNLELEIKYYTDIKGVGEEVARNIDADGTSTQTIKPIGIKTTTNNKNPNKPIESTPLLSSVNQNQEPATFAIRDLDRVVKRQIEKGKRATYDSAEPAAIISAKLVPATGIDPSYIYPNQRNFVKSKDLIALHKSVAETLKSLPEEQRVEMAKSMLSVPQGKIAKKIDPDALTESLSIKQLKELKKELGC